MRSIEKHNKRETYSKGFELTGAGARREEGVKMSMRFLGQVLWKDDAGVEMGSQGGSAGSGKATCSFGLLGVGVGLVEVYSCGTYGAQKRGQSLKSGKGSLCLRIIAKAIGLSVHIQDGQEKALWGKSSQRGLRKGRVEQHRVQKVEHLDKDEQVKQSLAMSQGGVSRGCWFCNKEAPRNTEVNSLKKKNARMGKG